MSESKTILLIGGPGDGLVFEFKDRPFVHLVRAARDEQEYRPVLFVDADDHSRAWWIGICGDVPANLADRVNRACADESNTGMRLTTVKRSG